MFAFTQAEQRVCNLVHRTHAPEYSNAIPLLTLEETPRDAIFDL